MLSYGPTVDSQYTPLKLKVLLPSILQLLKSNGFLASYSNSAFLLPRPRGTKARAGSSKTTTTELWVWSSTPAWQRL